MKQRGQILQFVAPWQMFVPLWEDMTAADLRQLYEFALGDLIKAIADDMAAGDWAKWLKDVTFVPVDIPQPPVTL